MCSLSFLIQNNKLIHSSFYNFVGEYLGLDWTLPADSAVHTASRECLSRSSFPVSQAAKKVHNAQVRGTASSTCWFLGSGKSKRGQRLAHTCDF